MLELAFLALLLGIKHSYDTDHLVAVSNYLIKSPSIKNTVKLSTSWAIGHMITAGIITVILYTFRETFFKIYLNYFEVAVAIMLIALGVYSFKDISIFHRLKHVHKTEKHEHFHSHTEIEKIAHHHWHLLGIGIVHGLASNDELLLLFTLSLGITSLAGILGGVAIFSIGVVLGMCLFGIAITMPLLKTRSGKLRDYVSVIAGGLSLIYGAYLLVPFLL